MEGDGGIGPERGSFGERWPYTLVLYSGRARASRQDRVGSKASGSSCPGTLSPSPPARRGELIVGRRRERSFPPYQNATFSVTLHIDRAVAERQGGPRPSSARPTIEREEEWKCTTSF